MRSLWKVGAFLIVVVLVAAACNGDDGTTTPKEEKELLELTAATPFPGGIDFYQLYVAQERGYFADEGLSVTVEPVDGGGATLQQLIVGNADMALPSPGPFMAAVGEGADLLSVYVTKQKNVFSLQTLADSDIQSVEDLRGKTIGVSALTSGEVPFTKALLAQAAGLKQGDDYEFLEVGQGGPEAIALERGEIYAMATSFSAFASLKARGLEFRDLTPPDFPDLFDNPIIVTREFTEENPDAVVGIGRALARATVWSMENPPEATLEITGKYFPEEIEDMEYATALLTEAQALMELPPEANGQWGVHTSGVERYIDFILAAGPLFEGEAEPKRVDPAVFTNEFIDEMNDFDPNDL